MLTEKLKALAAAKAELATLEKTIAQERQAELADLPRQYGFDTAADFIKAVRAASKAPKARGVLRAKKQRRAVITDATRAQVKALVEAGKTGSAIAAKVGISLPSVHNIKKALGLVQRRK